MWYNMWGRHSVPDRTDVPPPSPKRKNLPRTRLLLPPLGTLDTRSRSPDTRLGGGYVWCVAQFSVWQRAARSPDQPSACRAVRPFVRWGGRL